MKALITAVLLLLVSVASSAQDDKHDVRSGNRNFKRGGYKQSEIDYRKALVKDSTSFVSNYDLASSLYMQKDYESASKYLQNISEQAPDHASADRYYFNSGNVALQKKDYAAAAEAFKQSLLRDPSDLQAKESYIYAKKMMENQQNQQDQNQQGEGGGQDNENQDQDQNQQNQNQPQDQQQNQPQDNREDQDQAQNQPQISPQQAQQMLKAIQDKEKDTQEKVEKAKAVQAKNRQKEKNW